MNYELLIAFLDVGFVDGGLRRRASPSEDWAKLFRFYNENKAAGEKYLGMSCQPCYEKVHSFCKVYLRNQAASEIKRLAADTKSLENLSTSVTWVAANIDGIAKHLRSDNLI